jgi:predicted dehydrogenase
VTTTFATIGSGRRTRFFLRPARAMPERLRVSGVVTRDPGRADALTTAWGVPVSGTVFSHTTEAEIADLAQRTSDLRSAGRSTLVEGEV